MYISIKKRIKYFFKPHEKMHEEFLKERWHEVLKIYKKIKKTSPKSHMHYIEAAKANAFLGNWEASEECLKEGMNFFGDSSDFVNAKFDICEMDDYPYEALRKLYSFHMERPDNYAAFIRLIKFLIKNKNIRLAIKKIKDLKIYFRDTDEFKYLLTELISHLYDDAKEKEKKMNLENAISQYLRIISLNKFEKNAYISLCKIYRRVDRFHEADEILKKGLEVIGVDLEFLVEYAENAMHFKFWDVALDRWNHAKNNFPDYEYIYQRAINAANLKKDKLSVAKCFSQYRNRFGLKKPDPQTCVLLENMSKRMMKKRRICFMAGTGFTGNTKYAYLYLNKISAELEIEVCWITEFISEYELLLSRKLPVIYWDFSAESVDYLLRTDVAVYQTSNKIENSGIVQQACLSGAKKIQLWHGIPAKKIEYEYYTKVFNLENIDLFSRYAYESCIYDHLVIESEIAIENYRNGFPCAKIHPIGSCRTDVLLKSKLFSDEDIWGKEKPTFEKGKKIVLYAPTYREKFQETRRFIKSLEEIADIFSKSNDFVLLFKPHQITAFENPIDFDRIFHGKKNILYIRGHEDIHSWLSVADYLITDYSSIYYDFLITLRPILFFQPDLDDYESFRERACYDVEKKYNAGPVVKEPNGIVNALLESSKNDWLENRKILSNEFHKIPRDGRTTERVVNFILSIMEG